eukprot:COSAG01_NODE_134_length_24525_cov_434.185172_18_plen_924_part_00
MSIVIIKSTTSCVSCFVRATRETSTNQPTIGALCSLVIVFGGFGAFVYSASDGELVYRIVPLAGATVHSAAVDRTGKYLLATGWARVAAVFPLQSTEHRQHDTASEDRFVLKDDERRTYGGCFDNAGERLAYVMRGDNPDGNDFVRHNNGDFEFNSVIVICSASPPFKELHRIEIPSRGGARHLQFSPCGSYLLWVSSHGAGSIMIFDANLGTETPWSPCLRGLSLPEGRLLWNLVVSWLPDEGALQNSLREGAYIRLGKTAHDTVPKSLVLCAAISNTVYLIDVNKFIQAFDEGGNFTVDQMTCLSVVGPQAIHGLVRRWPHLSNIRKPRTLDTVLHRCVQHGGDITSQTGSKWLTLTVPYSLLVNRDGHTALHEAVMRHKQGYVQMLLEALDPNLDIHVTDKITETLVYMAEHMPRSVVHSIKILENRIGTTRNSILFREWKQEAMDVAVVGDFKTEALDEEQVQQFQKNIREVQHSRRTGGNERKMSKAGTEHAMCLCSWQLMALKGFCALRSVSTKSTADRQADRICLSPFVQILKPFLQGQNLELENLLKTELVGVTLDFKYRSYMKRSLGVYFWAQLVHFIVATCTMQMDARLSEHPLQLVYRLSFQIPVLITNTVILRREWRQAHGNYLQYFKQKWNWIDLGAIIMVYLAVVAHVAGWQKDVAIFASFAVLFNSFSLLQVLAQSYDQMVHFMFALSKMARDVRPLLIIALISLWGFAAYFAISDPYFRNLDGPVGNGSALDTVDIAGAAILSVFFASLGAFETTGHFSLVSELMFVGMVTVLTIFMMNLLIAVMTLSYERVQADADVYVRRMKAQTIVEEETSMELTDQLVDTGSDFIAVVRPVIQSEERWRRNEQKPEAEVLKRLDALETMIEESSTEHETRERLDALETMIQASRKEQETFFEEMKSVLKKFEQ